MRPCLISKSLIFGFESVLDTCVESCFLTLVLRFHFQALCQLKFIRNIMSESKPAAAKRSPRLHVDGAILGYQRGLRNQKNTVSLIKIKGVDDKAGAEFYYGKKVAFITKGTTADKYGNKFRVNWGKVCRSHGSNGVVRCRFSRNLPPQAIGGKVRVMLYPSRV